MGKRSAVDQPDRFGSVARQHVAKRLARLVFERLVEHRGRRDAIEPEVPEILTQFAPGSQRPCPAPKKGKWSLQVAKASCGVESNPLAVILGAKPLCNRTPNTVGYGPPQPT